MFLITLFNSLRGSISTRSIIPDDRGVIVNCVRALHEIAPGAETCACGKYLNAIPLPALRPVV